MRSQNEFFGVFITLLGGVLWGFSSVCGQYLFTQKGVSADWLVPYRLSIAGLAMVAYYVARSPRLAFAPLKDRVLLPQLLIYAFFGLMMTQYSYFCGVELSNAAVATGIALYQIDRLRAAAEPRAVGQAPAVEPRVAADDRS